MNYTRSFITHIGSVVVGVFCYNQRAKENPSIHKSKATWLCKRGSVAPSPGQLLVRADQTQTHRPARLTFLGTAHTVLKREDLGSGQPAFKSQFFSLAGQPLASSLTPLGLLFLSVKWRAPQDLLQTAVTGIRELLSSGPGAAGSYCHHE